MLTLSESIPMIKMRCDNCGKVTDGKDLALFRKMWLCMKCFLLINGVRVGISENNKNEA